jgi:hypothetical protein
MPDGLITGTEPVETRRANPIGVDVFDCDRRTFLKSVQEFLADPSISQEDKAEEVKATTSAVLQMAALMGITVHA